MHLQLTALHHLLLRYTFIIHHQTSVSIHHQTSVQHSSSDMLPNVLTALLAALWMVTFADASKIVFAASPPEFKPFLTHSLTLHCGLNDTSNGIVGRDVTTTVNNAKHVTQVMITRGDGTEVASVNTFSPAKSLNSTWAITVTGRVGSTAGERGFLEVSFDHPDEAAAGTYKCVVDAFTEDGHHVVYTQTVEVKASAASIADLFKQVSLMDAKVDNQEEMIKTLLNQTQLQDQRINAQAALIHTLETTNTNQNSLIKTLEATTTNQDSLIKTLEATTTNQDSLITTLQTQIHTLQTDTYDNVTLVMNAVAKYRHIETGVIDCSLPSRNRSRTISRTFSQAYDQTPRVTLAISSFDIYDSSDNGNDKNAMIDLQSVDTTGFSVRCLTTSYFVSTLHVTWTSFPN